jgi:hypothetical protein
MTEKFEIAAQAQLLVALIGEQHAFRRLEVLHVSAYLLKQVVSHNNIVKGLSLFYLTRIKPGYNCCPCQLLQDGT